MLSIETMLRIDGLFDQWQKSDQSITFEVFAQNAGVMDWEIAEWGQGKALAEEFWQDFYGL